MARYVIVMKSGATVPVDVGWDPVARYGQAIGVKHDGVQIGSAAVVLADVSAIYRVPDDVSEL